MALRAGADRDRDAVWFGRAAAGAPGVHALQEVGGPVDLDADVCILPDDRVDDKVIVAVDLHLRIVVLGRSSAPFSSSRG